MPASAVCPVFLVPPDIGAAALAADVMTLRDFNVTCTHNSRDASASRQLGLTNHSQTESYAGGLKVDDVLAQQREVDRQRPAICNGLTSRENRWYQRGILDNAPDGISARGQATLKRAEAMTPDDDRTGLLARQQAQLAHRTVASLADLREGRDRFHHRRLLGDAPSTTTSANRAASAGVPD
jgi:hypothetical protein